MSTIQVGHGALQILRGTTSRIKSAIYADSVLNDGQLLYDKTKNYLWCGDGITKLWNKAPIAAAYVQGFTGDWDDNGNFNLSTDVNPNNEYYIKMFGDTLVFHAPKLGFDGVFDEETMVATATEIGMVKLGSDTKFTGTLLAVSDMANRTYPIQLNNNNQMVVTVPFPDDVRVKATAVSDNVERPILSAVNNPTSGTAGEAYYNANITYNASTQTMTCTNFNGTCKQATKVGNSTIWLYPESSNQINIGGTGSGANLFIGATKKDNRTQPTDIWFNVSATTTADPTVTLHAIASKAIYAQGVDPASFYYTPALTSGTVVGTICINGTVQTIYCNTNTDTDTKVTQTVTTASGNYPILMGKAGRTTTATEQAWFDSGITINPSTHTITATTFNGNAKTATTATNVNGGTVNATTGNFTSTVSVNGLTTLKGGLSVTAGNVSVTGNITATGDIRGNKVYGAVWT